MNGRAIKPGWLLPLLLAFALVGSSVGCLGKSLSEEAKPQTPEEHFIVAVQEYRLLADQATEWLAGITVAAQAGDQAAAQYRDVAVEIGKVLALGNLAVQEGASALANADGVGLEKAASTLEGLTQRLATYAFLTAGS